MWSTTAPASALSHFLNSDTRLLQWVKLAPGPESAVCQLRSLQSSPQGERGAKTQQRLTHLNSALVCVSTHTRHNALPSRWQCVWAAGLSVTWAAVCLSGLVIEHTSLYTKRHKNTTQIHTHTHTHSHNPHPGLKQKHDTSVLAPTCKLYFTLLFGNAKRFDFHHLCLVSSVNCPILKKIIYISAVKVS